MVSREHKKAGLREQLQLLRSVTHSNAVDKTSILGDAARYIEELKQKVVKLNQEIAHAQSAVKQTTMPKVTVQTLGTGFLIKVVSIKNMPGLLVSVLEAFEELGLHVLEARASCADSFRLEAVGGENQETYVDAHLVKEAVLQAIRKCSEQD
ncbi:hypothetical protein LUZ63_007575 [Rhynchospora breviuscula]|uniref:Plant bHLH transcription factor ACT-like domain-containing protein n=1 Tax=Rhynchospora breviuscula TaxID=2022672 RepID=A0A9Q0CSA9_9POAL|nr:hypothetical protein LUZ63_007575 [Rhynchospora breviuscula]